MVIASLIVSMTATANTQVYATAPNLTAEEKAWIAEHPVIISSFISHYVPYSFIKDDQPTGFSIDYLLLVTKKVGLQVDFAEPKNWTEAIEQIKQKKIDLFHSISQNPTRDEFLSFTEIYHESPVSNYAKSGSPRINSIADLELRKVGVIKESQTLNYYKINYPQIKFSEFGNVPEALEALNNNEIDVFSGSDFNVKYYMMYDFITGMENIGGGKLLDRLPTEYLRLASHKDVPILRDILQKGMDAVTETEFYEIQKN